MNEPRHVVSCHGQPSRHCLPAKSETAGDGVFLSSTPLSSVTPSGRVDSSMIMSLMMGSRSTHMDPASFPAESLGVRLKSLARSYPKTSRGRRRISVPYRHALAPEPRLLAPSVRMMPAYPHDHHLSVELKRL